MSQSYSYWVFNGMWNNEEEGMVKYKDNNAMCIASTPIGYHLRHCSDVPYLVIIPLTGMGGINVNLIFLRRVWQSIHCNVAQIKAQLLLCACPTIRVRHAFRTSGR